MNKRIEQLKLDSTIKVSSHGAFGESESYDEVDLDKFAELIIKECMEVGNLALTDDYDDFIPSELISNHFGVE